METPPEPPKTKVAIIGTGLAGLTTAYLLQHDDQKRYSVTLFEQAGQLSFDAASVAVRNDETGAIERVDLPMRASAAGYYSNLMQMYKHLEIPLHPVKFLFVFAEALSKFQQSLTSDTPLRCDPEPDTFGHPLRRYFVHASNLHQTPPPWPGNRGVVAHVVETIYLIVCYLWFTIACFLILPATTISKVSGEEVSESFADYLDRICLPRRYASRYLIPLMSSVSTCTHSELLSFPASDVVSYKKLSHGQQHFAVCGGVSQVQAKLSKDLEDVRLSARVVRVSPRENEGNVGVQWQSLEEDASQMVEESFDRVVLAVSPDVAGKLFAPLSASLEKIPTAQVESSVLTPVASHDGSEIYSVLDGCDDKSAMGCMHHGQGRVGAQTIMFKTLFSPKGSRTEAVHTMPSGVVVSTCPLDGSLAGSKQTLQHAKFTRTLRTVESRAVVEKIMGRGERPEEHEEDEKGDGGDNGDEDWLNGDNNVWLAGAWCWDGMVLLEGCVVSAMQVADDFGVRIPWTSDADDTTDS